MLLYLDESFHWTQFLLGQLMGKLKLRFCIPIFKSQHHTISSFKIVI